MHRQLLPLSNIICLSSFSPYEGRRRESIPQECTMSKNQLKILVLCTGNSCRSQMAEGFFRAYGSDNIEVFSAGLEPGGLNPLAVKVMAEIDIDNSGHTSNNLHEYLDIEFDYVITVCNNAAQKCPVFLGPKSHPEPTLESHPEPVEGRLPERVNWPIPDPASALKSSSSEKAPTEDEVMQVFRKIRDEIGQKIKTWLKTRK